MRDPLKQNTFYNHFPTPEYLTLSNCGVAISDGSLHFIQFSHGLVGNGLNLSSFEKITLPEGVVDSGFINDTEKLTAVLRDLASRYRLSFVRATLPEERAYLFTTTIDRVPSEGLRDAVAFIIEENVPVTLAESVFDFDILTEDEHSDKIEVTVAVLSKKVVNFYLQVFRDAGITPVSFDIESQAIARAVVPKGDKSTQLIVNLGRNKTGFYVVEDEVVQFTTTLPIGVGKEGEGLHQEEIKSEMGKIFTYWSAHHKGGGAERKVSKVLLCGEASISQGFVSELESDLGVPHSAVNPWANISSDTRKLSPELIKDAMEYIPAIGLAIPHPHRTYV
jgi:Tfp pilus assembly PilM family ATPase